MRTETQSDTPYPPDAPLERDDQWIIDLQEQDDKHRRFLDERRRYADGFRKSLSEYEVESKRSIFSSKVGDHLVCITPPNGSSPGYCQSGVVAEVNDETFSIDVIGDVIRRMTFDRSTGMSNEGRTTFLSLPEDRRNLDYLKKKLNAPKSWNEEAAGFLALVFSIPVFWLVGHSAVLLFNVESISPNDHLDQVFVGILLSGLFALVFGFLQQLLKSIGSNVLKKLGVSVQA